MINTPRLALLSCASVCVMVVPAFAATPSAVITTKHVEDLLQQNHISDSVSNLRAVIANTSGDTVGFLFDDGRTIHAYKNAKRIYEGSSTACSQQAYNFKMTEDGHIVHALDCSSLYIDDQIVSAKNATILSSDTSAIYTGSTLTFAENDTIKRVDIRTGVAVNLYQNAGWNMLYVRQTGTHLAYSAQNKKDATYALFEDGKKVSAKAITNPWNYLVDANGDVYYAVQTGSRYVIYKNAKTFFTGRGLFGFIFENEKNTVMHIGYVLKAKGTADIYLFKGNNPKNLLPSTVGNVEGFMSFQGENYAERANKKGTNDFYLLKNGIMIGSPFTFDEVHKDFNGSFFGMNGKVYMRNYDLGRWKAYEDGKAILTNVFQNVWFLVKDANGNIVVYGSGKAQ